MHGRWIEQEVCPLCGSPSARALGLLSIGRYWMGSTVALPPGGVPLRDCTNCGLVYKTILPDRQFLADLIASSQHGLWADPYHYEPEIGALARIAGSGAYDLLDVGAASGDFLRAAVGPGRRSALDVVRFERLRLDPGSEFIHGFLDDRALNWSGRGYDVVSAFDVLEHLYDPATAMANLDRLLVPGGTLLAETGDSGCVRPDRLRHWNYLAGIDHHIAWNRRALDHAARRFGFTVVEVVRKRHKLAPSLSGLALLAGWGKHLAHWHAPAAYRAAQRAWSRNAAGSPGRPNLADHLRVVLRKL